MPYFLVYLLDTWGWYLAFGSYAAVRPSFLTLFRVRWAGESINNVVPSAYVGGEALKVYLLHKRGFSGMTASTSVVASKTCQVLAQVVFIGLGALAAMNHLPAGSGVRNGMMLIMLGAFGVLGPALPRATPGECSAACTRCSPVSPFASKPWKGTRPHLRKLDDQIYAFYQRDRARFFHDHHGFFNGLAGGHH
jgi:uncharacterized membrane protein YbhN (UPF0104 family)